MGICNSDQFNFGIIVCVREKIFCIKKNKTAFFHLLEGEESGFDYWLQIDEEIRDAGYPH